MYASHLNQCRLGQAPAPVGTSASGRSRRRGRPSTRRRPPPSTWSAAPGRGRGDEVEGGADPGDPRDHVQQPEREGRPGLSGSPRPPVPRDRAESPQPRLQLLLAFVLPLAQHREQLSPRAPVHEDDELEAEAALVLRSAAPAPRAPGSAPCCSSEGSPIRGCIASAATWSASGSASATSSAELSGSERPASLADAASGPRTAAANSATVSCRGSSRTSTGRRAAARGSGLRRGRPPARPA